MLWHHHKYADQEDENDDDEGKSLMEVTADLTNHEGDGADENDEKVLISRNMHQVSVESMLLGFFFSSLGLPTLLALTLCVTVQRQVALLRQLQLQLRRAREESTLAEQRVRDEVSQECTKIFSQMQEDFE